MQFPETKQNKTIQLLFFLFRHLVTLTSIFQRHLSSHMYHSIYKSFGHNYLKQDVNYRTAVAEREGLYENTLSIQPA